MECTIDRSALLAGLGIIAEAISSRRAHLPILEHTCITASDTGLTLMATDTEIELRTTVTADVRKLGSITMPCQKILGICRSLPSGAALDIRLTDTDKEQITLKSGRSRFVVHGLNPEDFPVRTADATDAANDQLTVPVPTLRSVLEKARQVMPQGHERPYLNGVLLKVNGADLIAVATNGHVMIRATTRIQKSRVTDGEWILPAKGVRALLKILATDDADADLAHLTLSANAVTVVVGPTMLRAQLISGRFPDVERVIPRYAPSERITIDVGKNDLHGLVERVGLMTVADEPRASAVVMTPEADGIRAQAGSQEGEAVDFIDANITMPAGVTCEFGINPAYCTAILSALDTERTQITLRDGESAGLFQGLHEGAAQEDVVGVLMPVRL